MPAETTTVASMLGKTVASITGAEKDSPEVVFTTTDGDEYRLFHEQDCCESVSLADVTGDPADLVGAPLLMAEEVSNDNEPKPSEWADSWTWTFYKFGTIKGYVTLRWLGESNGYYSESVGFAHYPARRATPTGERTA